MIGADLLLTRFLLALCVWREARGETDRGMRLVAQVIVNRSTDPLRRWPRTIPDVILQPLQFSSFNHNDPNATLLPRSDDPTWPRCVAVLQPIFDTFQPPITKANHYHVRGLEPSWADPAKVTEVEGRHVFYCL